MYKHCPFCPLEIAILDVEGCTDNQHQECSEAMEKTQPTSPRVIDNIAMNIINHIDTMYPAMWKGVPKIARTSLRNTIKAEVKKEINNE